MLAQLTIAKDKHIEPALDYQQLYAIGLEHVQKLASRLWTDYNVHDPGITALELLCYALTDLSYRATLPVKDLLASKDNNAARMAEQFFTARDILTNRAYTALDYRKLLIDLPGVKNAWLQTAPLSYYADKQQGKLLDNDPGTPGICAVAIEGLYHVVFDYMEGLTKAQQKQVREAAQARLHANRNLCEDFVSFSEVKTEEFVLCSELELAPEADAAKVKAEILFQIERYLAPAVYSYTLEEMLERGFVVDAIFDGPQLDCGFIVDEELQQAELRTEVRLSDVISIIMDIDGVRAVRDIVINQQGIANPLDNKWLVPVTANKKAVLDHARTRLVFYKKNMPILAKSEQVKDCYEQLVAAERAKLETVERFDLPIPLGRYRDLGNYYSFQNHFPTVYGLSEVGLSGKASALDQARLYQLKAYLLFFDQLMANYFAQLAHIKELFSTEPTLHRSYFYQAVKSFRDYSAIYAPADVVATIENHIEDKQDLIDRRNRFLNHLIARFAEQFTDYAQAMYSAFGASPAAMVLYKCEFLSEYPAISSTRAVAYNYSLQDDDQLWNSDNISGLERRLCRLLGIRNCSRRNLGDVAYDIYAEIDADTSDEFRFRIRKRDTGKIVLSSSTHYATQELARAEMRIALNYAMLPAGYEKKTTVDGKYYFNVIDETGEVLARRIEYFATEDLMLAAIDELMDYLQVNYSDEGMYLIENILLRPEQANDPFLPICPASSCDEYIEEDPYSYRLHIILPAYSARFANMDFRRFVEASIRAEVPAHILPKICWISKEDMAEFEKLYRDWLYLKSGRESAQRTEKLTAFIKSLFTVKNVYPSEKLHACDAEEDKAKFILSRTALGSAGKADV